MKEKQQRIFIVTVNKGTDDAQLICIIYSQSEYKSRMAIFHELLPMPEIRPFKGGSSQRSNFERELRSKHNYALSAYFPVGAEKKWIENMMREAYGAGVKVKVEEILSLPQLP